VQRQVHHPQQRWHSFLLVAIKGLGLQEDLLFDGAIGIVTANVIKGGRQKTARTAGRVVNCFTQLRVDHFDHKTNDRARGIKLASDFVFISQAFEQGFVYMRHGVHVILVKEINLIHQFEHIFKVITGGTYHNISFRKDGRDRLAERIAV